MTDQHDIDTSSQRGDQRAANTGMPLADFECRHGNLEPCGECDAEKMIAVPFLCWILWSTALWLALVIAAVAVAEAIF